MLSMMFRETDRVQRMNSSLCLILFDIDDFGHWNSRLGSDACDELLCQVVARTTRLLRSYDILGRAGQGRVSARAARLFQQSMPSCSPSACASKSSLRPSTSPAMRFASPPASASPPARAARLWSSCAKRNRRCMGKSGGPGVDPMLRQFSAANPGSRHISLFNLRRRTARLVISGAVGAMFVSPALQRGEYETIGKIPESLGTARFAEPQKTGCPTFGAVSSRLRWDRYIYGLLFLYLFPGGCCINAARPVQSIPQGLKPRILCAFCGTAKAVPFQSLIHATTSTPYSLFPIPYSLVPRSLPTTL